MDILVEDFVPAPDVVWQPGDAWLAGGSWLYSQPQPGLSRLLDLRAFGWPSLVRDADGLQIAATCTLAELAAWQAPEGWAAGPLVGQCCRALLGSFKVWNVATVGGNISLSLPAGPMTSLTAALDGVCEIWSTDGSVRHVPVLEFVTGAGTNTFRPGDLLRAVHIATSTWRRRTAFRQLSLSPYGRSAVVVIGTRDTETGAVDITVTASTPRPVRVAFAQPPAPTDAVALLDDTVTAYHADVHGHPAWRAALTRRYVAEVASELAG